MSRPFVLALAFGAGGCAAIMGISEGQLDADPFGTAPSDAAVSDASDDAPRAPSDDATPPTPAPEASSDAPTDALEALDAPRSDGAGVACGLLIDDLEDGDINIIPCQGRNGSWYMHNDGTVGGTQIPDPFLPSKPGYDSTYSAYTKGSGFTVSGAEIGFHFVVNANGPQPYDLSAYTGITFMAKSATANFTLYVNFPDANTCPGATNCGDTYGKGETIGTSWAQVSVPFSVLATDNPPPHPFDAAQVYGIEFHAAHSVSFEFWVDNVTLTK